MIKAGSRRQVEHESNADFLKRISRSCTTAIKACSGDLSKTGDIYGVETAIIEAIVEKNKSRLGPVVKEARRLAFEVKDSRVVEEVEEKDHRKKRSNWSTDPTIRLNDILSVLPISLVENEGDIAECSECLNIPIHEIHDLIDSSEKLQEIREVGLRVKSTRAESKLYALMDAGNQQSVKMVLNNLDSERWGDRQQVDVRRVGFAPPSKEEADVVSIFDLVKGDENA